MGAKNEKLSAVESINKLEKRFNVIFIGDYAAGKTNFIWRSIHGQFDEVLPTIGIDIKQKIIELDRNTNVYLSLHDTSGQERYKSITQQYYRNAVGCLLFFDVSRTETFSACKRWKIELDQKARLPNGNPISCVLIASKCDLLSSTNRLDQGEMDKFCRENGFVHWFQTSAKEDININDALRFLVQDIISKEKDIQLEALRAENIKLTQQQKSTAGKGCCGSKKPDSEDPIALREIS